MVGDDDGGVLKKSVRLKAFGADARMGLPGGIRLNVEASGMRNKIGGQGQKTDVVEQCGKRQMMQRFARQFCRGADVPCQDSGPSPMPPLPRQGSVDHLCRLPDEERFDSRS